jgi:hypothetical protein
MMQVPDEFRELCLQFQLASLSYHRSVDRMIASAVSKMDDDKKKIVRDFLGDLLNHDLATIEAAWTGTPSDFFFGGHEQLVLFLRLIQKQTQLASSPP